MLEATFQQAYPMALRAARARATAAVLSGAAHLADRDDLQQEGLTAFWRALPQFDPTRASLRTFMERVVASRLASVVRTARRAPANVPLNAAGRQSVDPGTTELELRADIHRIVSLLHPGDRQLILVLQDHSPAEASRLLGIPRSTLHGRVIRLRQRFIDAGLAPEGIRTAGADAIVSRKAGL